MVNKIVHLLFISFVILAVWSKTSHSAPTGRNGAALDERAAHVAQRQLPANKDTSVENKRSPDQECEPPYCRRIEEAIEKRNPDPECLPPACRRVEEAVEKQIPDIQCVPPCSGNEESVEKRSPHQN